MAGVTDADRFRSAATLTIGARSPQWGAPSAQRTRATPTKTGFAPRGRLEASGATSSPARRLTDEYLKLVEEVLTGPDDRLAPRSHTLLEALARPLEPHRADILEALRARVLDAVRAGPSAPPGTSSALEVLALVDQPSAADLLCEVLAARPIAHHHHFASSLVAHAVGERPYEAHAVTRLVAATLDAARACAEAAPASCERWHAAFIVEALRNVEPIGPAAVLDQAEVFVTRMRGLEETAVLEHALAPLQRLPERSRRGRPTLLAALRERWSQLLLPAESERVDNLPYLLARLFHAQCLLGQPPRALLDAVGAHPRAHSVLVAASLTATSSSPPEALGELFRRTLAHAAVQAQPRTVRRVEALALQLAPSVLSVQLAAE